MQFIHASARVPMHLSVPENVEGGSRDQPAYAEVNARLRSSSASKANLIFLCQGKVESSAFRAEMGVREGQGTALSSLPLAQLL
jgi:hypothetical protein